MRVLLFLLLVSFAKSSISQKNTNKVSIENNDVKILISRIYDTSKLFKIRVKIANKTNRTLRLHLPDSFARVFYFYRDSLFFNINCKYFNTYLELKTENLKLANINSNKFISYDYTLKKDYFGLDAFVNNNELKNIKIFYLKFNIDYFLTTVIDSNISKSKFEKNCTSLKCESVF